VASALDPRLVGRLRECEEIARMGASFRAIARLGEVLAFAETIYRPSDERRRRVMKEILKIGTPTVRDKALQEAAEGWARVEQVLNIGSVYDSDEILLVVTERVMIQFALPVFQFLDAPLALDIAAADERMREIAGSSKKHRGAFLGSVDAMQRHWIVPIENRWTS
jgi:hypothetical protein